MCVSYICLLKVVGSIGFLFHLPAINLLGWDMIPVFLLSIWKLDLNGKEKSIYFIES